MACGDGLSYERIGWYTKAELDTAERNRRRTISNAKIIMKLGWKILVAVGILFQIVWAVGCITFIVWLIWIAVVWIFNELVPFLLYIPYWVTH